MVFFKLSKTVITLLSLLHCWPTTAAAVSDPLPDIGTTAGGILSINQELALGDFYQRQMRARAPIINDPLLSQYINQLGNKLVLNAHSVLTPFHFYLINNDRINAFAFFGGNVVLHSSLLWHTENESELASVIAHEIVHVTQRHLARAMEETKSTAPLTWVGMLGSVLLTMANPQAGMAALNSTIAGNQQGIISFTQLNEQEADRLGIQILQRSGFDPQAMASFLRKLADQARYADVPLEILQTHPLPESRVSDVRNRADQMPARPVNSSQEYWFAKVRILAMYSQKNNLRDDLFTRLNKSTREQQLAAKYGQAIMFFQTKNYGHARHILEPLLAQQPDNIWFLDLITDIDLAENKNAQAIARLQQTMSRKQIRTQNTHNKNTGDKNNEKVLQLNLANAYIKGGQLVAASKLLYSYTFAYPDDLNGWDLLTEAMAKQGKRDEELASRAERLALCGDLSQAIEVLSNASTQAKLGSLNQARYDTRIDQLRALNQRFRQYTSF